MQSSSQPQNEDGYEQKEVARAQPNKRFLTRQLRSNMGYNKRIDEQKDTRKLDSRKEQSKAHFSDDHSDNGISDNSDSDKKAKNEKLAGSQKEKGENELEIKELLEKLAASLKEPAKKSTKAKKIDKDKDGRPERKENKRGKKKETKGEGPEDAISRLLSEVRKENRKKKKKRVTKEKLTSCRESSSSSSSESDGCRESDSSSSSSTGEHEKREKRPKQKRCFTKHTCVSDKRKVLTYTSDSSSSGGGSDSDSCSEKVRTKPLRKPPKKIGRYEEGVHLLSNTCNNPFSKSSALSSSSPSLPSSSSSESDKESSKNSFEEEIVIRRIPKMYDRTYVTQKILDGDEGFLRRFETVVIRRKVPQTYTCNDLKKLFECDSSLKADNNSSKAKK